MNWKKVFKSAWIHQIASWVTIVLFISLILNKILNIMISQPNLFLICIVTGSIASALIFSAHAYLLSKKSFKAVSEQIETLSAHTKQIDYILDILKDLHPRFWDLSGDVHRSMAYTFRDSSYTSFILWLRSAEAFNRSGNIDMARETLQETYKAIKQVEKVTIEDLNEINKLIPNIDPDIFKHEVEAINTEILRLTMS